VNRTVAGTAAHAATVRARSRTVPLRTHPGSGWDANVWLLVLLAISFAVLVLGVLSESAMPISAFFLPMVVGYLVLEQRRFSVLVIAVLACAATNITLSGDDRARMTALVVMGICGLLLVLSSHRSVLGARRGVGEAMLIDLRDRLMTQSELPELPDHWYAQALLRSAGGDQFAGDFIVAATTGTSRLEVVVVDVSGKGLAAGTRALQLSGAFGGLLGAMPSEEFMSAANNYLLRQSWDEGFATAAHLTLDLADGRFVLQTAGHPPGLQYHAGSGRWELLESGGPALGLLPDGEFLPASGVLRSGDSMLLYTDGLVETPDRDFRLGIDKLLGEAERLMSSGWDDSALRLLDRLESSHDDRAILLLHRR
jgi:hypothetical protein